MRKSRLDEISFYPMLRVPVSALPPYSYVGVEHLVKDRGGVCLSPYIPNADSAIQFHPGDILIGNIRPYLKKIWLSDITGGASGDVIVVRIRDEYKDSITPEYLYKVLSSDQFFAYDNLNTKGAKMPRGDKKAIAAYLVPIPSIDEQQRIVDELDLLTSLIDKKNAQLRDLDALAQSIFYEMFGDPIINDKGWPKKMLKELGQVITGNTPSTKDVKNYATEDVCFFKPSDISKDSVTTLKKSEYFISSYAFEKSRKLPKGSVLTTCIGIVGKVGILSEDATCNQQINAIIPEIVESPWLAYAIFLQKKMMEEMANAPVVPIINKGDFSRIIVPVPPEDRQEQFSRVLKDIDRQKETILFSKSETEKLLTSRMSHYFD